MKTVPYQMGEVAHDLRMLRQTTGLTGKEMAQRLGISQQYLCDIEQGKRRLTDDRILAIEVTGIRSALISSRICEYEAKIAALRAANKSAEAANHASLEKAEKS